MAEKQKSESFQLIREGFAKARFGGTLSGCPLPGSSKPFSFATPEGGDNAGLNPEEYVARFFRLLSAATTPYRFYDFSRPDVLKAAVPLFEGLTLYANHYADVTKWKGFCQEPAWDDQNDPPGINCLLVLDRLVDANLARGVETKALRACSVTIWFEFERSHPELQHFWDRLGEEVDGQVVRLIVTRISNAGEVSIVWEGEDPFAKALGAPDGEPGMTTLQVQDTNDREGDEEMKLSAETLAILGIAAGTEITEAMLKDKFTALAEQLTGLKSQVETLKTEADLGRQLLRETRERATTLYKAVKGDSALERFITGVIQTADLATARALCEEYESAVDDAVPLTCPKCGEKLSRRSSQPERDGNLNAAGKRAEDYKL
jgi:predicted RNA-binding Zn-ribbon protein involved in translation (DUF1610 family)